MHTRWPQFVPNMSTRHPRTLNSTSQLGDEFPGEVSFSSSVRVFFSPRLFLAENGAINTNPKLTLVSAFFLSFSGWGQNYFKFGVNSEWSKPKPIRPSKTAKILNLLSLEHAYHDFRKLSPTSRIFIAGNIFCQEKSWRQVTVSVISGLRKSSAEHARLAPLWQKKVGRELRRN